MAVEKSQNWLWAVVLVVGLIVAGIWWLNRGYGEVSPQTYEYSKAIYSACLTKSEEHLGKVEAMLASEEPAVLSAREKGWLESIVATARDGKWQAAAKKARRIMEDQVEY